MEWQEWRSLPETRELLRLLRSQVNDIQKSWGEGAFTFPSTDETVQMNSKMIGVIEGLNIAIGEITEDEEDDESVRE